MDKRFSVIAIGLLMAALFSAPAFGEARGEWRQESRQDSHSRQEQRHDSRPGQAPHWRGDIHRFHDRDFGVWRGGDWRHGHHNGHLGWWWVVGGIWYFYPEPIYPYPDPYVPPVVVAPGPAGAYWYYCNNPPGYYPYVPQCAEPWQPVPATSGAPPQ